MEKKNKIIDIVLKVVSYILVAALASVLTLVLYTPVSKLLPFTIYPSGTGAATDEVEVTANKLRQLLNIIDYCHVADVDVQTLGDERIHYEVQRLHRCIHQRLSINSLQWFDIFRAHSNTSFDKIESASD